MGPVSVLRCGKPLYTPERTHRCTCVGPHQVHVDDEAEPSREWTYDGTGRILLNEAACLRCGEVVTSRHRHELSMCGCGAVFVDGGNAYLRRGVVEGVAWEDRTVFEPRPLPTTDSWDLAAQLGWLDPVTKCGSCGEDFVRYRTMPGSPYRAPECGTCHAKRTEAHQILKEGRR